MRRLIQALPFHAWKRGKWGHYRTLDCRRCRLCGRFEIVGYGDWHRADFDDYSDAVFA